MLNGVSMKSVTEIDNEISYTIYIIYCIKFIVLCIVYKIQNNTVYSISTQNNKNHRT